MYIIDRETHGDENHNVINEIDLNATTENNTETENETNTENTANEVVTPTIEPNVTEEEINSDYVGTEEQEAGNDEQTVEEKVIELVKNQYGTDQGVSFNIANVDGNMYYVSVNDIATTAVLAWYSVDISTDTVTEQ